MPPTPSPNYERLREYIAKRMRMSHVYPNASSGWWARFAFNGITRCCSYAASASISSASSAAKRFLPTAPATAARSAARYCNASARAGQSSLSRILAKASSLADPSTLFSTTWTINSRLSKASAQTS